uniref:Uncharacterized protein LOC100374173 n=1 Tax=Saccoglossus kowalevskii TaxID=10224 RepID=A0ABM0MD96_SACKO|nr:PREDICTED: uncharacterized protein LOC100374173 [Saccoglossus kowalevskii]
MLLHLTFIVLLCRVRAQLPEATDYLGVGYNIVLGNPEGTTAGNGGLDPGLLGDKQIFELTYDVDGINPDQAEVYYTGNCTDTVTQDVFWGTQSYQDVLDLFVEQTGVVVLSGYEFTESEGYDEVHQTSNVQGSVYDDDRQNSYCGYARYKTEEAQLKEYPMSSAFANTICNLPTTYEEEEYMDFIDTWGTCPSCIHPGGAYLSWNSSLIVDMDTFVATLDPSAKFGSEKGVFDTGTGGTEPAGLKLINIAEALDLSYWRQFCYYVVDGYCEVADLPEFSVRQAHIMSALQNYAQYKNLALPSDPIVQTPLTWPEGSYGLPLAVSGCPVGAGFEWARGSRFQDTENDGANSWSTPYRLEGPVYTNDMQQNFCTKTTGLVSQYDWSWSKGQYCIYKYGGCPQNFLPSYVYWDDEDDFPQLNSIDGTLPDGTYDRNTQIMFCCRNDGDATTPMYLPFDVPFFLIKSTPVCQQVGYMVADEEWFRWDTQDTLNEDDVGGIVPPYNTRRDGETEHQLHYCYYS